MKRLIAGLLAASVCLLAQATSYTWTNPAGGAWAAAANWDPNIGWPNSPNDTAVFTNLAFATTAPVTITLPAGPVTAGVVRVYECTNVYVLIGGRLVLTNGASTNVFVTIAPGTADIAGKTRALEINSELELLQDTTFNQIWYLGQSCCIYGPLHGARNIRKLGIASSWLEITNELNTFSGTVFADVGGLRVFNNALATAARIQAKGGVYLRQWSTTPITFYNGSGFGTDGGSNTSTWTTHGSNVFGGYTTWRNYGDLVGTGTVYKGGNTFGPVEFYGAIKPGFSIGDLSFIQRQPAGAFRFGAASDHLDLFIEVAGVGGVPGVDFDRMTVNMTNALDLSAIDLRVSGLPSGVVTNWFLSVPGAPGFSNQFAGAAHTNGYGVVIVYDSAGGRGRRVAVPAPPRVAPASRVR